MPNSNVVAENLLIRLKKNIIEINIFIDYISIWIINVWDLVFLTALVEINY
mgnify:CR=1 FL=1